MQKGYSLHIGLNKVDNLSYSRSVTLLNACQNDAKSYLSIAMQQGFHYSKLLLDASATSANFQQEIEIISSQMQAGDLFFLSFSGHGGRAPSPDSTEADRHDESWCFYDGEVQDNQLFKAWQKFKKGSRIYIVSDSCHSGTILRDLFDIDPFSIVRPLSPANTISDRSLKRDPFEPIVKASVKLLAAAREDRVTYEEGKHGAFTKELLNVWNNGAFEGNYQDFYESIKRQRPLNYSPAKMDVGISNIEFNHQRPFQINV